ncbi:MAG: hypothetical protein HY554_07470 [Elusimicrobia bacterium]|nr:hypothetical protein [Elusimicrobiota bacterium]
MRWPLLVVALLCGCGPLVRWADKQAEARALAARQEYLKENPGLREEQRKAILDGNLYIGMDSRAARLVWGHPYSINRTVTASGEYEQWIYHRTYLYFENGKLTAFQEDVGAP